MSIWFPKADKDMGGGVKLGLKRADKKPEINPIPILINQLTTKQGFKPLLSAGYHYRCEEYYRMYREQKVKPQYDTKLNTNDS